MTAYVLQFFSLISDSLDIVHGKVLQNLKANYIFAVYF